jgi:hypothetical protein
MAQALLPSIPERFRLLLKMEEVFLGLEIKVLRETLENQGRIVIARQQKAVA